MNVFALHDNAGHFCVAAVRKEIQDETDRETGRTKQISSVPIHLSIYSPMGKMGNCICLPIVKIVLFWMVALEVALNNNLTHFSIT